MKTIEKIIVYGGLCAAIVVSPAIGLGVFSRAFGQTGSFVSKAFDVTNMSSVDCKCLGNGVFVMGMIKNIDNKTHESIRVSAAVFDRNGSVIGVGDMPPFSSTLAPGQDSPFQVVIGNVNQSLVDHFIVRTEE